MTSEKTRALLRFGVPIDLVAIATGIALLYPTFPVVFSIYLIVVAIATWSRRWRSGVVAVFASLLVQRLQFDELFDFTRLSAFFAAAMIVCAAVELSAPLVSRIIPRATTPAPKPLGPPDRIPLRSAIAFGLPLLIVIVYTNISDVLLRTFGIPSLLQPLIILLAWLVWKTRRVLQPSEVMLQPVVVLAIVYCAILFISSAWARDIAWADAKIVDVVKGVVIFIVAASLAASWRRVRAGLTAFAFVAALLAAISVAQTATGDTTHQLGGLASFKTGNVYEDVSEPRASGPVGDPNFYGQILLIMIPVAAFLALTDERRNWRLTYGAVTVVITAGMLVTYSRGAILSTLVMLALFPFVVRVRPALMVAAAVALVALVPLLPANVTRRVQTLMPGDEDRVVAPDASVQKRKLLVAVGARMFDDQPFFGVGAGNFGRNYWHYANEVGSSAPQYDDPGERQYPHSLYLELATETGLAGALCFLAAMAAAFVSLFRSRRELLRRGEISQAMIPAALALALAGHLVSSTFLHGAYLRYLWLLLAFVPAVARLARGVEPPFAAIEARA